MQSKTAGTYDLLKRWFIGLAAVIGWIVSFHFSVQGFGVQVKDQLPAAYGLVIMFTGLELAFSTKRLKLASTLVFGALVAYGYGIWTNVLGIYVIMHPGATTLMGAPWGDLILPGTAGTGLEVIPEALLVYALMPSAASSVSDSLANFGDVFKDMLGKLFGGFGHAIDNAADRFLESRAQQRQPATRTAPMRATPTRVAPVRQPAMRQPLGRPVASPIQRPEPAYHVPSGSLRFETLEDLMNRGSEDEE